LPGLSVPLATFPLLPAMVQVIPCLGLQVASLQVRVPEIRARMVRLSDNGVRFCVFTRARRRAPSVTEVARIGVGL